MRGADEHQDAVFSYRTLEQRVPEDHPLRVMRLLVDEVLKRMSPTFSKMYSKHGRPSKAPEKLLRALLLQALYTIRSERMLMEQLDYNLLFRWFVGLGMDEEVWDATVFTKNRNRMMGADLAKEFLAEVLVEAETRGLMSDEHFTVDGTLIEAWAGQKSFKKKEMETGKDPEPPDDPGNPTVNFRGEKRTNETHQSTTDPESRLYKKGKGKEAKLSYMGHVLMENRNGLVVGAMVTQATGKAEEEAAVALAQEVSGSQRVTMGADKAYDRKGLVEQLREINVTPHVAQNEGGGRKSAIDGRTTRHPGYGVSQTKRKRIEEIFGWMKSVGMMRKTRHRGQRKVDWIFTFVAGAYNLIRIRNLIAI